jgi:hypothetical protein
VQAIVIDQDCAEDRPLCLEILRTDAIKVHREPLKHRFDTGLFLCRQRLVLRYLARSRAARFLDRRRPDLPRHPRAGQHLPLEIG